MQKLRSLVWSAVFVFLFPAMQAQRAKYNFNPGWLVQVGDPAGAERADFDDTPWKHVTLPYAWNEDAAYRVSIHDLPVGVAWYRKHFTLPADACGSKVFLEFEGIRHAGEVYINGKFLGRHEDGVMAFGMDLTGKLKPAPADNVIAVRTDNRWDYKEKATNAGYHWNNTNFYANYGGISKNVYLHLSGKVYQTLPLIWGAGAGGLGTTGTYVWAADFDQVRHSATVTAESQVRNESGAAVRAQFDVAIEDMQGKVVARFHGGPQALAAGATTTLKAGAPVSGLHFWSWGYGYLYNVVTSVSVDGRVVDRVTTRTGFRQTGFSNGMVTLNGRVIQIHGYAQRTTNEWPAIGLSVPAWMSDLSNGMMVEGNGNLVRWMHVTPWKQDVESSDRVDLIESMPAGDAEGDSKGRQWEQRVELMRDAVVYNRNNPSILFYESGNKGISEAHMADMKKVRDQYDPHGGRAVGAREMLNSRIAEYGGEMLYVNKSAAKPVWAHEYSRDEGARAFVDEDTPPFHKDSPLYNRNQDSMAIEDVKRWYDFYAERPGTGTRVSSGGVNIIFADSNTHFRGDNNYRRSGEVDAMRLPKDGFFAHQVMWDGWVDVEHPRLHIVGHWNYANGVTKNVYVVSSAEKVELFVNGRSLGFGEQSTRFLYTFKDVHFAPGTLRAVGYDAAGKRVAMEELQTAGAPVALKLTLHTGPGGLRADGADLALVDVEVVDAKGRRVPTATNKVSFALAGPAEWRGGIAQGSDKAPVAVAGAHMPSAAAVQSRLGEDNHILATTLPVEAGVNRVIVRSAPLAGTITVRASAEGLTPATVEFASRAIAVAGGLSRELPGDGLPSILARGETPQTPSFRVSRVAIPVASVTAGSAPESAAKSYDDDETTSWASDGERAHAWIEYAFASPQTPTQLELKLNGFRQHRYPLRVSVDSQTVWEGLAPASLGYVTLPLQPASGTRLRVEMTGPAVPVGQLAGTTEVNGKVEVSGVAPVASDGKVVLNIIEAEIYRGP